MNAAAATFGGKRNNASRAFISVGDRTCGHGRRTRESFIPDLKTPFRSTDLDRAAELLPSTSAAPCPRESMGCG